MANGVDRRLDHVDAAGYCGNFRGGKNTAIVGLLGEVDLDVGGRLEGWQDRFGKGWIAPAQPVKFRSPDEARALDEMSDGAARAAAPAAVR